MNRKGRRTAIAKGRQRARRERREIDRQARQLKRRIEDAIRNTIAGGQPYNEETKARIVHALAHELPPLPPVHLEPLPSTPEEREARTISFRLTGEAAKRLNDLMPEPEDA